mmetsp:Transcript_24753/g.49261  ORF Transcript_24753/g.49261 Transcript_24753/m.49261 type:complete len:123 (+) Transcript_24753:148-516(+)
MYGQSVLANRKRDMQDIGAGEEAREEEEEDDDDEGFLSDADGEAGGKGSRSAEEEGEEGRRFSLSSTTPLTPSESEAESTSKEGSLSGAGSIMKKMAPKQAVSRFATPRVTAKLHPSSVFST